ncbi:hypothetical protein [Sulfitobacter guttiformis]|uniref:Membrane-bound lysozyme inhibitor of c-type lysozyme MliC n=1 Tax=Sulfitobacter guttiformis TaxID=74349 RepID=A0A420DHI9_9RHOB|nr:hypothetical protein [Sulfitobacter guttiformis]RKE93689.1 hypothetical protein C8N30_2779 [Sulfitobacter guttiformis]
MKYMISILLVLANLSVANAEPVGLKCSLKHAEYGEQGPLSIIFDSETGEASIFDGQVSPILNETKKILFFFISSNEDVGGFISIIVSKENGRLWYFAGAPDREIVTMDGNCFRPFKK